MGQQKNRARSIIDEALKAAETKKREALLEVKEESLRTKNELEKETKERRNELQKYESVSYQRRKPLIKKLKQLRSVKQSVQQELLSYKRKKEE